MWANALSAFYLADADPSHWDEAFRSAPLKPPGPSERSSCGFVLNPEGVYCDSLQGRHAFIVGIARRHLPKDAVEREVTLRGIEAAAQGRDKPSWEQVELDMLATAPIREERVPAIYDATSKALLVWSSARIAGDFVLPAMIQAIGGCLAHPWLPASPMQALATEWLRTGELPLPFSLGEEVELAAADGDGKIKVSRQDVREASVLALLEEGRLVKAMEVRWAAKLSFRINAKGEMRRVGPPECKLKPRQAFEMWPDIVDDLFSFFEAVVDLTGGLLEEDPAAETVQGAPAVTSQQPSSSAPVPARPQPALVVVGEGGTEQDAVEFLSRHQARRPWGDILVHTPDERVYRSIINWARETGTRAAGCSAPDLSAVRGVAVICPVAANEPLMRAARAAGIPVVEHRLA